MQQNQQQDQGQNQWEQSQFNQAISIIKNFYPISQESIKNLQLFVELVKDHNKSFNLIGKSTLDNIWTRHILDCATIVKIC